MNSYIKLPQINLYLILISCGIIISSVSLETMIIVKDVDLYNKWLSEINEINSLNPELFNTYVSLNLIQFSLKVITPMALAIHSYFAFFYTRINKLFVFIWTALTVMSLGYTAFEMRFESVFYFISILSYIVLIYGITSITKSID